MVILGRKGLFGVWEERGMYAEIYVYVCVYIYIYVRADI